MRHGSFKYLHQDQATDFDALVEGLQGELGNLYDTLDSLKDFGEEDQDLLFEFLGSTWRFNHVRATGK